MPDKNHRIVYALTGRDKGRYFAILCEEVGEYALLVDGSRRTIVKPKRKNFRHFQETGETLSIPDDFRERPKEADSKIRRALAIYSATKIRGGEKLG